MWILHGYGEAITYLLTPPALWPDPPVDDWPGAELPVGGDDEPWTRKDVMQDGLFPTREFRALSLWQPHAQAIRLGIKLYETRGWATAYRGPLVIHSAQKVFRHQDYPRDYFQEACMRLSKAGCPHYALSYGEALCIVDLVDCLPVARLRRRIGTAEFWGDFRDFGDDGKARFAFKLQNVRKVWPPLKVTGRQGFFRITIPEGNEALKARADGDNQS